MTENYYTIGVDLDNTIINFDELIYRIALDWGLIEPSFKKSKKLIRDKIRRLADGENKWQQLQAFIYGEKILEAKLFKGVRQFFRLCQRSRAKVYIISHKTEYAGIGTTRVNLRQQALSFLERNKFFKKESLFLSRESVYFEASRSEKIRRIEKLGCTHFIDDLTETFNEASFPEKVEKILYDPHGGYSNLSKVRVFARWRDINEYFFNKRNRKWGKQPSSFNYL